MASSKAIENKIKNIASKSTKFKIGKTTQHHESRLKQHKEYSGIQVLAQSRYKQEIDQLEAQMISRFIDHKKCKNQNTGSAGWTPYHGEYKLYVVYS